MILDSRHVKKASESESFIDKLISGFIMEFHHFFNEYDGILSFLSINWRGVYDEGPSYDGFSSLDVCLAHQMVRS